MAIQPTCAVCGIELDDYGAILLSPPDTDDNVKKYHICKKCYNTIVKENNVQTIIT